MKSQHGGRGVKVPSAPRASAAPDTIEHILTSIPALRRAGLDELADSVEAMARDSSRAAAAATRRNGDTATPSANGRQAHPREPERRSGGRAASAAGLVQRMAMLAERSRLAMGWAIVVLLASFGRLRGLYARTARGVRHSLIRRRELVWGVLAVSSISLLAGWVITRLP